MKTVSPINFLIFFCFAFFLFSCDKGYQVRFSNYYIEPMDSVVLGNNTVVFTNVQMESHTAYNKIGKGSYRITCVSKTKRKFYSNITIPASGSGKRSIQIDGINSISILED